MTGFLAELQRRNVYKVAVAYLVVAWFIIQVATQVFPFFAVPTWVVRLVVLLSILGFPVALILAWAFEWTPEGIVRTRDLPNESKPRRTGRKLTGLLVLLAALAGGLMVFRLVRSPATDAADQRSSLSSEIERKSIAVLPFENLSEEKANAYFAEGIQDEILSRLSKIAELRVISHTSTQRYKSAPDNLPEIARQLTVAHILEGSVQKQGDRVRVNVQLIRAADGSHLWAETFDRELTDIFSVESDIARAIADACGPDLRVRKSGSLPPDQRKIRRLTMPIFAG